MATGSTKFKNSLNLEPVSADPGSPAEGDIQFSDGTARAKGLWIYKDSAWVEAGSSGSGGINYLEGDNSDAENGVGDWLAYADAAATTPADGTGGAPTTTFAQSADTTLRGTANLLLTKDAANRQGEGAGVAFTIDAADKAKKLTISFDYLTSANYADDDIKVFVYDVTNTNLIRINGEDLKANANSATHYAQFQTASDSTSYRLILHISSTNASAYTCRFDNVKVGPTNLAYGTVVTDWEDVTLSWSGTGGTLTSKYRRVGDTAEFQCAIDATGGFGGTPSRLVVTGFAPDTDKILSSLNNYQVLGSATYRDQTGEVQQGRVSYDGLQGSDLEIRLEVTDGAAGESRSITSAVPWTWASTDEIHFNFKVPIAGWSSNAQISEDLGGREVVWRGEGNVGETITANTERIPFAVVEDTTASVSTTTNADDTFTAPETGYYQIEGSIRINSPGAAVVLAAYVNGSVSKRLSSGVNSQSLHFSGCLYLTKGDTLGISSDTTITVQNNSDLHWITVRKVSSPQTLLETETVAARYTSNNGQTVTDNTNYVVKFEDLVTDTHNAYNTTTGLYTIPVSGYYNVSALATMNVLDVSSGFLTIGRIYKNGSPLCNQYKEYFATIVVAHTHNLSTNVYCDKGDTISFVIYQNNGSNEPLDTQPESNVFSITRLK